MPKTNPTKVNTLETRERNDLNVAFEWMQIVAC